ncbi:hypothetical protein [Hydrogenimonas thermophila]|uniref:Uncharacterized protein n=1 Tax=Hydrogenimonas thermophila TaxID=223786 RepID=A0A1I5U2A5_9BACT|nr:hypothetical protein [Hydrogenimonas thermophila]SFP89428.1 hypothetical protein SAMN05216234_15313 [Hydrogenimonas thermophila]
MDNRAYTLLVFEGERTEEQIFNSLNKYFFNEDNPIIYGIYANNIYKLYNEIKADEDLDIFMLLKENQKNGQLENIKREDVAEIYLFFDYDGHDTQANNEAVDEMIELFNNETEYGKLYINYPMVESIRHISKNIDFKELIHNTFDKKYKNRVHNESDNQYKQVKKYNKDLWLSIIKLHLKKANYIANNVFEAKQTVTQKQIFQNQLEKYIVNNQVAILSSIALFVVDWYGLQIIDKKV